MGSAPSYYLQKTLVDLLREKAEGSPGSAAVVARDRVLSYADLQDRALSLASGLASLGVVKGHLRHHGQFQGYPPYP